MIMRRKTGGIAVTPRAALGTSSGITNSDDDSKKESTTRRRSIVMIVFLIGFFGKFVVGYYILKHAATVTTMLKTIPSDVSSSSTTATKRKLYGITVDSVRNEFEKRYGGKHFANKLYEHGIQMFGSIDSTAKRILTKAATYEYYKQQKQQQKGNTIEPAFVVSFAGYSVTVGRGNHFNQSFPFVMERILKPLLYDQFNGLNMIVRNSAIGGIPSFPYGFCFEHFLGIESDVISWDYSMNENGKDASVLEAYIRQSQSQLYQTKPMLIVLDTNQQRCSLLQTYTTLGYLQDALCVGMAKDAMKDPYDNATKILEIPNDKRPIGFQNWDEFGASSNCPGRGNWHPKKQEHELIGWMIAMYFVNAIDKALVLQKQDPHWIRTYTKTTIITTTSAKPPPIIQFPPPLVQPSKENEQSITDLLYGHPSISSSDNSNNKNNNITHTMHTVSCRTIFLPATDVDKNIPSIIVSGLSPDATTENIIATRSDDMYMKGWVLDVSDIERDTKIKVEKCGGLGYIDMKIALYGIPESGPLRLWLPLEGQQQHSQKNKKKIKTGDDASNYFENLIICEANEKRSKDACQLDTDVHYTVGGVAVTKTNNKIKMIAGAAEYLKRRTCVHVGIPPNAQLTVLKDVTIDPVIQRQLKSGSFNGRNDQSKQELLLADDHTGIVVEIQVVPSSKERSITRKTGACCLSHIVWEQYVPP